MIGNIDEALKKAPVKPGKNSSNEKKSASTNEEVNTTT